MLTKQIEIKKTGEVITPTDFYERYPCVSFPQPLTDEVLSEYGARLVDAPTDIELLRATTKLKIEQWRDSQENSSITFTHKSRVWDGGLTVRQRLQPVVALQELPSGFFWTDHDNNDVPVTLQELRELCADHEVALVARGFEIHARQRLMKSEIANMQRGQLSVFEPAWERS